MQRGSTAIVIGKMPITPEEYLAKHKYAYSYSFSFNGYNKEMKSEAYSFPNKWIIDAVNLSVVELFVLIVTDPLSTAVIRAGVIRKEMLLLWVNLHAARSSRPSGAKSTSRYQRLL